MVLLRYLLFFVILLPFVELLVLFQVSSRIGAVKVFSWLAVSFLVGSIVHRRSAPLSIGRISGILLMVPGFVTDFLALLFLLPGVRKLLLSSLLKNSPWNIHGNVTKDKTDSYVDASAPPPGSDGKERKFGVPKERIKDAEFRILPDEDSKDGG